MKNLLKKRGIAWFIIFLILLVPIEQAYALTSSELEKLGERTGDIPRDFEEQGRIIGEQLEERFEEGLMGEMGAIGEDIIINVQEYQPKIIRSSLLEDQGIFVYALLSGTPTNPTITIPKIRDVIIRRQKITTSPKGLPVSIGSVRHVEPDKRELSYNNMGYLVIPIRQVRRESEMPDEIMIDIDARIFFDVSEGLMFGPTNDILTEENHNAWTLTKEDHSFYAGYVRLSEIKNNKASFVIYDNNLNEIGEVENLGVGSTSRSLSSRSSMGYSRTGRLFDSFSIRLNKITGLSDKVNLIINRDGKVQRTTLSEGESLYPSSSWYVDNIITDIKGEEIKVRLRNKDTRETQDFEAKNMSVKKPSTAERALIDMVGGKKEELGREDYNKIVEEYFKVQENVKKNYKDYSEIINNAFGLLEKEISLNVKSDIKNLLLTIQRYYEQKNVERLREINLGIESEIDERVVTDLAGLKDRISKVFKEETQLPTSVESQEGTSLFSYRMAREEYQKLIDQYSSSQDAEIRKYVSGAHWKIANLPANIVDKETAIYHLEKLLNSFKEEEYDGFTAIDVENLLTILNSLQVDYQSSKKELTDEVTGEIISVLLAGVKKVPAQLKSKATIWLQDVGEGTYYEGDLLLWNLEGEKAWTVDEINDGNVIILNSNTGKRISLNENKETSIEVIRGKGNERKIRLVNTEIKKETHITISPNVERAFSEAIFTLHLPVEKRALDLPLFSDTIEEEIEKTEELLEKLDGVLENVGKITEYWQKFCMITFATLWVKNFASGVLGGSKDAAARNRVSETFKEKYKNYQGLDVTDSRSCKGLTYDQCVFKNQQEYEGAIETSKTILEEIETLEQSGYYKEKYGSLGSEYNDIKNELYYQERFSELNPNDEEARNKLFNIEARLKNSELEKQFELGYFAGGNIKSYDQLEKDIKGSATGTLEHSLMQKPLQELYDKLPADEKKRLDDVRKKYGTGSGETYKYVWDNYKEKILPNYKEAVVKKELGKYLDNLKKKDNIKHIELIKESYGINEISTNYLGEFKHSPSLTLLDQGRNKGNVEFISIDPFHYVQTSYTGSGRVGKYELFKRSSPNSPMGHTTDVYLGVVDQQLVMQYKKYDKDLSKKINGVRDCISKINKKSGQAQYARGENVLTSSIGCASGLGNYKVEKSTPTTGPSCTDFMGPSDCKILFNACDPVICPTSRCNLGGEWYVDNVAETGLIGSTLLCLPNFAGFGKPGGVIMPICLTGIYAGLQNIRSIIEGYRQCLVTAQTQGRSVGICDRIRNFGICEILWKEGIAIFSAKKSLLSNIMKFLGSGKGDGGGEYSSFEESMDNSVEGLKYFTQSYAKNTFARYSGGSLPEIGTEICKSAIFGKVPGIGNFFDEISRPESPPQFNAFFDEVPYSDISQQPLSQYKIFYHIYAGENEPITYSVYMQTKDPYTGEFVYRPTFIRDSRGIVRNRRLLQGSFASESPDMILPAGFQEICVEISSDTYGRKVECGFGKVSTGFALNYITDQFTQSELNKKINSADECVSASSGLYQEISERGLAAGTAVGTVGTLSSGFVTMGIVRKCSKVSPGVGGNEGEWTPVGSCGTDERGRDLGTCWLYNPAAKNLIKQVGARTEFINTLNQTAIRVIDEAEKAGSPIPGFYTLSEETIAAKFSEAEGLASRATKDDTTPLKLAREKYSEIISAYLMEEKHAAKAQYLLAETYIKEAKLILRKEMKEKEELGKAEEDRKKAELQKKKIKLAKEEETLKVIKENLRNIVFKAEYNIWEINLGPFYGGIYGLTANDKLMWWNGVEWTSTEDSSKKDDEVGSFERLLKKELINYLSVTGKKKKVEKCEIVSGYWGKYFDGKIKQIKRAVKDEEVLILLDTKGCIGEDFFIELEEFSKTPLLGSSTRKTPIKPIPVFVEKNNVEIKLKAPWQGDLFTNPEYVFKVFHNGKEIFPPEKDLEEYVLGVSKTKETKEKDLCKIFSIYWGDENGARLSRLEAIEGEIITINFDLGFCEEDRLFIAVEDNPDLTPQIEQTYAQTTIDLKKSQSDLEKPWQSYKKEYINENIDRITLSLIAPLYEGEGFIGWMGSREYIFTIMDKNNNLLLPNVYPFSRGKGYFPQLNIKPKSISNKECNINKGYWGDKDGNELTNLEVVEGDRLTINLETENCRGKKFKIFVEDKDLSGNVQPIDISISNDREKVSYPILAPPWIFQFAYLNTRYYVKVYLSVVPLDKKNPLYVFDFDKTIQVKNKN